MDNQNLSGQRIWLTGASRGIGAAIADKLAANGATLLLSASSPSSFKNMVPKFRGNDNVFFFPCDLRKHEEIVNTYEKIKAATGGVDILINNAGTGKFAPMTELSIEDFDLMNELNFKAVFMTTKTVLDEMLERQSGTIMNILSVAATTTFTNSTVYGSTKAAVLSMDRSLREEVRDKGINVVDIIPGATETDIWPDSAREEFRERMMQPEDVADAVVNAVMLSLNPRLMPEEIRIRPQRGDL